MSFLANYWGFMAYQCHSRGDLVRAEAYYKKAMAAGDKTALHYLSYGVLRLQNGEFDEGIDILTRGLSLDVDERTKASIRCNRALGYLLTGRENKAMAALEDLREHYPCEQVYETLGYAYIKVGELDKAVAYSLEGVDYAEKNTVILDNLAQAYIALERYEEAEEILQRAFAIRDKQADLCYHQALCCLHRGEREEALRYVNLALSCNMNALNDVRRETLEAMKLELEEN